MGADQNTSPDMSVGEARKATQMGSLPLGTVQEILEAAPRDLKEELFDVPEWGYSLRLRSSSAAQNAMVNEEGFSFEGENTRVNWAEMEIRRFQMGVVEPVFAEEDVRKLHFTSGPGFQRVLNRLNELNNVNPEAMERAKRQFPGPSKSAEV
jgi:hypothetical protein